MKSNAVLTEKLFKSSDRHSPFFADGLEYQNIKGCDNSDRSKLRADERVDAVEYRVIPKNLCLLSATRSIKTLLPNKCWVSPVR